MDYIWINYGLWINYGYNVINIYYHNNQWEFQDPIHGGTLVPYKAIFCGDIPLHRPNK